MAKLRLILRLFLISCTVQSLQIARRPLLAGVLTGTVPSVALSGVSGTFSDPNHVRGSRTITMNEDGLGIRIIGIDDIGETPWSLDGFLDGDDVVLKLQDGGVQPPTGTNLEVLEEGGPIVRTFRGSLTPNGKQIKWPDGNVWTKIDSSST